MAEGWDLAAWYMVIPDIVEESLRPAVATLAHHYRNETMIAVFQSEEGRRVRVTVEFDGGKKDEQLA